MPVVDASVALAFLFPDEDGSAFEELRRAHPASLVAPSFLDLELLNAILISIRRGRFTEEQATILTDSARQLLIRRIEPDRATLSAVLPIAQARNLSVYDALYLSLAKTLGLPLATHDRRLRAAAEAEGLKTLP